MRPRKDSSNIVLGGKQLTVLQLVFSLKENAYGGQMYRVLSQRGETTLLPQIYKALSSLEQKGLVTHSFVESTDDKRGGKRKVYELTASGNKVLNLSLSQRTDLGNRTGWSIPVLGTGAKT